MSGLNVPVDWRAIAVELGRKLGAKEVELTTVYAQKDAVEAELVKLYSETAADGEGSDAD